MPMRIPVAALSICAVSMLVSSANAQHIHDNHPASPHGSGNAWVRVTLDENWSTPFQINEAGPVPELAVSVTRRNGLCWPVNVSVSTSYQREHTVNVNGNITYGGSVEATAKLLAAEIKAKAHSQVSLGGGWSGTTTITYIVSDSTTLPACKSATFKEYINQYTANGSCEAADHRIVCERQNPSKTWVGFCNRTTLTGNGIGYLESDGDWTQGPDVRGCNCDCEPVSTQRDDRSDTGNIDIGDATRPCEDTVSP
jgi:hypothetical protein